MNYINFYFIYFLLISCIGWVYESLLAVITRGRWENRGFLFGPLCPIYGTGALLATLLFTYVIKNPNWIEIFLIGVIGSAVLELTVSYTLEYFFHAVWWDYSKVPLNFQGRISLPTALCFGIAALLIIYGINPLLLPRLEKISDLGMYLLTLISLAILSSDTTITVCVLSNFEEKVSALSKQMDSRMEKLVSDAVEMRNDLSQAIEETKNEFPEERVQELAGGLNFLNRHTISRISHFTKSKKASRDESLLNRIKNRVSYKKVKEDER